jgi:lipopolysaccharide exporter
MAEVHRDLAARVGRALAWSTVNNLVLRVGNLALGIVLARLLAPAEFGVFAVALTLQAVLLTLAELGMSADLIRQGDIEARAGTATTVSTISSGLLALGMVATAAPFAALMGSPQATPVVQLMSLTLVLSGVSCVPFSIMQRDFRQPEQTALGVIGLGLDVVITVSLVLFGLGAMALAISRVCTLAVTTAVQFSMVRMWPRFSFDRNVAAGLIRFGAPLAVANLVYMGVTYVPNLLVGRFMGTEALGFYLLAFNIASWPMNALGAAVRAVALPAFARIRDPVRKAEGLSAAAAVTMAWAMLAGVLLSALATSVIPFLYGAKWLPSAQALAGLAIYGSLRVVAELVAAYLIAAGTTRSVLVVQLVWVAALVPSVIAGIAWGGLTGAGWASALVAVGVVLPAYLLMARRHHVRVGIVVRRLAAAGLCCLPAAMAGWYVAGLVDVTVLALLAGGLTTTAVYAALLARPFRRWCGELRSMKEHVTDGPTPAAAAETARKPDDAPVPAVAAGDAGRTQG